MTSADDGDVFARLLAKQQELERIRAAIKELQSLEKDGAPPLSA